MPTCIGCGDSFVPDVGSMCPRCLDIMQEQLSHIRINEEIRIEQLGEPPGYIHPSIDIRTIERQGIRAERMLMSRQTWQDMHLLAAASGVIIQDSSFGMSVDDIVGEQQMTAPGLFGFDVISMHDKIIEPMKQEMKDRWDQLVENIKNENK